MEAEKKLAMLKGVGYTVAAIVALIIGWIWYANNHYTFVYDNNFVTACTAQGATENACGCALDIVKHDYSFYRAKEFEQSGNFPQETIDKISYTCAS